MTIFDMFLTPWRTLLDTPIPNMDPNAHKLRNDNVRWSTFLSKLPSHGNYQHSRWKRNLTRPRSKKRGSHYTSWWSPRLAIICIANRKMMSCIYILAAAEMAPIGKWPLYSSSQSKWLLQSIQIALSSAEESFLK